MSVIAALWLMLQQPATSPQSTDSLPSASPNNQGDVPKNSVLVELEIIDQDGHIKCTVISSKAGQDFMDAICKVVEKHQIANMALPDNKVGKKSRLRFIDGTADKQ